jgi:hypothetical protein
MQNTDTLANIVRAVRAEAGHSLSTVQGTNTIDTIKYLVQRTQVELWTAYQWPTLKSRIDFPTAIGQYLYVFPTGSSFEQVREVWASQTTSVSWTPVAYGVTENMISPLGGPSQKGGIPQFWSAAEDQFLVWPTPDSGGYTVRLIVQKLLYPFLADGDMSTIDATAITLFTSAELLARAKAEDASVKLQKAQKYVLALLGNSITNRGATPYLDFIPQHN